MRVAAWLWLATLGCWFPLGACSGDYPLPPTPCDDLCHVTQGLDCSDTYEPAVCVLSCERSHLDAEDCRPYFDQQLACLRQNPGASKDHCFFYSPTQLGRCALQIDAFQRCIQSLNLSYGFDQ